MPACQAGHLGMPLHSPADWTGFGEGRQWPGAQVGLGGLIRGSGLGGAGQRLNLQRPWHRCMRPWAGASILPDSGARNDACNLGSRSPGGSQR